MNGDKLERVYWPQCEFTKQLEELMVTAQMTDWKLMYSYNKTCHSQWVVFSHRQTPSYAIGMYLYIDDNTICFSKLQFGSTDVILADSWKRDKEPPENYLAPIKTLRNIIVNWSKHNDES